MGCDINMLSTNKRKRCDDPNQGNIITLSEDIHQLNIVLNNHWPDNHTHHIVPYARHTMDDETAVYNNVVHGFNVVIFL